MSTDTQTEKQPDFPEVLVPNGPKEQTGAALTAQPSETENQTGTDAEARRRVVSSPILRGWRLWVVQIGLSLSLFLGTIDSSIVATALVTIGRDFNDFLRLQWVVLAYLLTYLGFTLIFSRVSDVIGRKWASVVALVLLTAGSLGCGLSHTLNELIAMRAIQGIGGSGVYAMSLTAIPEITPAEKFQLLSGLAGVTITASSVLGPVLGGVITTHSTWRWIFLFNVPVGIFAIALLFIGWPRSGTPGKTAWYRLEVIGCLLYGGASVLLVFALQQAGAGAYAWSSPIIITCLVVAVVAIMALTFWIWYLSSGERLFAPLFPARIVLNRVVLANILVAILTGYMLFTVIIELPQRLQLVNGKSSQTAGVDLLPLLLAAAIASFISAILSTGKRNLAFYTVTGAGALALTGSALLSSVGRDVDVPHYLYGYEVIFGLGLGGLLISPIINIKLNAREEDAASAQGLASQSRILGGNIGISIATIILNAHLSSDLAGMLTPLQISDLRRSLNTIETLTRHQQMAVAASFVKAFKSQLQGCVGVSAASLIIGLLAWQRHPPTMAELGEKQKAEDNSRREQSGADTGHSEDACV